ncbi:MAG: hypothetical protein Q8L65_00780 [Burkholderiales bacterium]|nr:hypothetical protein [Burkholderiales bacterium]MDP2400316.1 hypothetical protein [Burkholderiales bacterium]
MNPKWRALDLEGGGLQAMNLRLARTLRRRPTAWLLLLLFPAGAHRWYLHEPVAAIAYPALTLGAAAGWAWGLPWLLFTALAAVALLLVVDIASLENRIATCNRRLRMAAYLSPGPGAPADFRGRTGDKPVRVPGFAEQEKLLRALAEKSADAGDRKAQ